MKKRMTDPPGKSRGSFHEGGIASSVTAQGLSDKAEPTTTRTGVPVAFIVVLGLLLYWGDMYVMENGADLMGKTGSFPAQVYAPFKTFKELRDANPTTPGAENIERGRMIYKQYCAPCHQENGQGSPATFIPPLAGSEWVLAKDPGRIIRIVLNGLQGPITVSGKEFGNAVMLPWRDSLTNDEDIAAVLTYIRQDWGNNASEVKAEQVKAIREETKDRTTSWTAQELLTFSGE